MAAETEEEKKAREDAAKADAARADEKLDLLLKGLDSVKSMCDAVTQRMDAVEAKADAAVKADAARKDAESEKEKEAEAEKEKAKADRAKKDGESEEAYADRIDSMRKDGESEEGFKERMAAKADKKKKADAEEEDAKKKADADLASLTSQVNDLASRMPVVRTDEDLATLADIQSRADHVALAFGERARPPMIGETPQAYRRAMATKFKSHSTKWKDFDLAKADSGLLEIIEADVYKDAAAAASSPAALPANTIRARERTSAGGHKITEFVGNTSFVRQFSRPSRRLIGMPGLEQRAGRAR